MPISPELYGQRNVPRLPVDEHYIVLKPLFILTSRFPNPAQGKDMPKSLAGNKSRGRWRCRWPRFLRF
jgi:hypothetical protein